MANLKVAVGPEAFADQWEQGRRLPAGPGDRAGTGAGPGAGRRCRAAALIAQSGYILTPLVAPRYNPAVIVPCHATRASHPLRSAVARVFRFGKGAYDGRRQQRHFRRPRASSTARVSPYTSIASTCSRSEGVGPVSRLPFSIKVLLEAVLRQVDGFAVTEAGRGAAGGLGRDEPGAGRAALQARARHPAGLHRRARAWSIWPRCARRWRGWAAIPKRVNPLIPVDLVIDHSVQVDQFGSQFALYLQRRARVRAQPRALRVPEVGPEGVRQLPRRAAGHRHRAPGQPRVPGAGRAARARENGGKRVAYPDTLVGTDSHTTMINGLGVLGWGVGGIEAEAVMLGQPIYMLTPQVVGFKLTGAAARGRDGHRPGADRHADAAGQAAWSTSSSSSTARASRELSLADRATIANMAPEYGATMGFFPVDDETLRLPGRSAGAPRSWSTWSSATRKEQGLFRTDETPDPVFTDYARAGPEHGRAEPGRPEAAAGPGGAGRTSQARASRRRSPAPHVPAPARRRRSATAASSSPPSPPAPTPATPSVMIGARAAGEEGRREGLAGQAVGQDQPGARLEGGHPLLWTRPGSTPYLDVLGFHTVGYGCTTCIGNSGPLPEEVAQADQRAAIWRWRRCSPATATSRAASIRWCGPTTWPARRWSWPTRWPARSTSI